MPRVKYASSVHIRFKYVVYYYVIPRRCVGQVILYSLSATLDAYISKNHRINEQILS